MSEQSELDRAIELLPCPFCGAIPQPHDTDFVVSHGPSCYFTHSYAQEGWLVGRRIKKWNTRSIERENQQLRDDLKVCKEALKEAGATISTTGKEQVRYPDHKRILFNGEDVTFKEMCDLTLTILDKAIKLPSIQALKDQTK